MSKTEDNLKAAFAGESQANRKYLAFAKKAEKDGFPNVAKLFRAVAEAETIHAHNHLRILGEVASTKDNLQEAIKGENYEFTEMYPKFIKIAEAEEMGDAKTSFNFANEVEKVHGKLYKKALEMVNLEKDIDFDKFFVCKACGFTAEGNAPNVCPVCGAPKEMFMMI